MAAGQAPLPEDEWIKLFKLPAEPSRLDSLLLSSQIGITHFPWSFWILTDLDQYCKQIDQFSSAGMMKMFAIKGMPVVNQ